ncbi:MAG: hypothetical protein EXR62_14410 [Chloroflexi bacterium]|nr:hypothetical protein [Chloroflexota bacterium]
MSRIRQIFQGHPFLTTWAVLAVLMVAILTWTTRGVQGISNSQFGVLVIATILLAGACVWIITWE